MTRSVPVPKLSSNLRLATPEDVMRIGVVATGGFRYSPIFQWMRPYHRIFPEDTVLSYRTEYLRALQNPNCVVLVALDKYDALENQKSEAIIPENDEYRPPVEGTEIVVGVASYRFQPNSERHGQFHYKDGSFPSLPSNRGRDLNNAHTESYRKLGDVLTEKFFSKTSEMSSCAVHPAYWGRGHGTRLVKWGLDMADIDNVSQGVLAALMGKNLYKHLGYELYCNVTTDGDLEGEQGVSEAVMEYTPDATAKALSTSL